MIDDLGPKRVGTIIMIVCTIGIFLMGFNESGIPLALPLLIMGFGASVTYANLGKMISNWFLPRRFPFYLGIALCIGHIGAAIGQPLIHFLIKHYKWSLVLRDLGLVGMIYTLVYLILMGVSSNQAAYNANVSSKRKVETKQFFTKAIKNRSNWFLAISFGILEGPRIEFIGLSHIQYYNIVDSTPGSVGIEITMYTLLAFSAGLLFFGWLAQFVKKRKLVIILGSVISSALLMLAIYFPHFHSSVIVTLMCVSTFFAGAMFLVFTLIHEKNHTKVTATVISMVVVCVGFFRLLHEILLRFILSEVSGGNKIGKLFFTTSDFQLAFLMIPISLLISLVFLGMVKDSYGNQLRPL